MDEAASRQNLNSAMKKGFKALITGLVIFVVSVSVFPVFFILPLLKLNVDATQFEIPGKHRAELSEAGKYVLWNHYETIYEGKTYNRPEALPDGLLIEVRDAQNRLIPLINDRSTTSSQSGTNHVTRQSIATFTIEKPTTVEVIVSGDSETRILSLEKSMLKPVLFGIFGAVLSVVILSLISFGLIIWGIVKLTQKEKVTPPRLPESCAD